MPTTNKRIKGNVPVLTLSAQLLAATTTGGTFATTGTVTAWPDGTGSRSYEVAIGTEDSVNYEVILCSSRSGNTHTIETRGIDGTTASQHEVGEDATHVVSGASIQQYEDHIVDTTAAHAASSISYAGSTNLSSTDVEAALDELDTEKADATTTAASLALKAPLASPTFTGTVVLPTVDVADNVMGKPKLKDYAEVVEAVGNSGTTKTLDVEAGNIKTLTLTGNCTLTLSNPSPTGNACTLVLILTQDGTGSRTITWPASVKWAGGVAPTLSTAAGAVDIITLVTINAGTTWYGFVGGQAFA